MLRELGHKIGMYAASLLKETTYPSNTIMHISPMSRRDLLGDRYRREAFYRVPGVVRGQVTAEVEGGKLVVDFDRRLENGEPIKEFIPNK